MAVAAPVRYNDYWVYLRVIRSGHYGSTHLNPSKIQTHNAYMMRAALQAQGYDETAIAAIIGNAQVESGISPGMIQKPSVLPNGAENLEDVPNSYMLQYYTPTAGGQGYGLGLLSWDRFSATYLTNDLLGWTNANGYIWYDGEGQMARLDFEFQNDATYNFWRMNYGSLTWADFKQIETTRPNYDIREAANVWAACWELSSISPEGREHRKDNAAYWLEWFRLHPVEPKLPIWLLFNQNKKGCGINVKRTLFL